MKLTEILSSIPPQVHLIAVSKLQPTDLIYKLYLEGQKHFGENYVQELLEKKEQLENLAIHWHFIGHLQRKKVKSLIGKVDLIHSVDSVELAIEIDRVASLKNLRQDILLQINLSHEPTKGGLTTAELPSIKDKLFALKNCQIRGLMTMPPLTTNAESARPFFRQLFELRELLKKDHSSIQELSMGTTQDYKIAIEEGATMIRLGTIIFGERPRKE